MQTIISIILGILLYKLFFGGSAPMSRKDLMNSLSDSDREALLKAIPPQIIDNDKTLYLKIERTSDSFHDSCGLFFHVKGPFNIYYNKATGVQAIDGLFMPNTNNYVLPGGHIFLASLNHKGEMEWSDGYGKYVKINKASHYFKYIPTRCRHCGKPIKYESNGVEAAAHTHSIHRYCDKCKQELVDTNMFYPFFIDKMTGKMITIHDKQAFRDYLIELFQIREMEEALKEHNPEAIEAEVQNAKVNMTLSDYTCNLGEGMAEECFRCLACI